MFKEAIPYLIKVPGVLALAAAMAWPCAGARAEADHIIVHGKARFTIIAPELIRMEYSETGAFVDAPSMFAADRGAAFTGFALGRARNPLVIDTGRILLTHNDDGKPFSADNLSAEIRFDGGAVAVWKPGMENTGNLGGAIRTVDGVGEPVDLGQGFLSRDGWFLHDDSDMHLFTKDWVQERPAGSGTDWYLFGYGHDYLAGLKAMTKIGGRVPLPRKYSLGVWYSRYWPYTSKEYREIVAEYHNHDFPLDVMVLDMDWHKDGWTGWSWNRKLLPDAEDLLQWFHEKGLHTTLNVHPADSVGKHEDMYAAFMKDLGEDPSKGHTVPFDAGSKKYLDTLFKHTHMDKEAAGVDFWWLDWQQYPYTRSVPGLTNLRILNHYYYTHTGRAGLRGQSFSRYAGFGDHRYPVHFSGDSSTEFAMLQFMVPFTSLAGNAGVFYWSHDIGGHMGRRIPESYVRWTQFGATTAALRSHSTRNPELDRRPWKYQSWAENAMRAAFHLRSELFPYIYSTARQCFRDSMPMNRAMYMAHPEDARSYVNPQQYYFGDALLAAPIVSEGKGPERVGAQVVWFPEGRWVNWFTGERFEGGDEALVAGTIDEFPLYARAGVPIPMQPYRERMATAPLDELVVRVFPAADGATGEFTLYEDDGVTTRYLQGEYAETALKAWRKGDEIRVSVGPAAGSFQGQPLKRAVIVELPFTQKALSAAVKTMLPGGGGDFETAAAIEYDEQAMMNRIRIPAMDIRNGHEILAVAADTDPGLLKRKAAERRLKGLLGEKAAAPGNIKNEAVSYSNEYPSGPFLDTLLAIAGAGVFEKNDSLYYYKSFPRAYFYAAPGLFDNDKFTLKVVELYGNTRKALASKDYIANRPARYDAQDFKLPPAPPEFGMRLQNIIQADFTVNGKPFSVSGVMSAHNHWLDRWTVVGPFDYGRGELPDSKFGPELDGVDFDAVHKTGSAENATGVAWRKARAGADGVVDLQEHYYNLHRDNAIAYAVTYIVSREEQDATFRLNSDDASEMWVNGEKVLSRSGWRGMETATDIVKAHLKKGPNEILLKVSQHNFKWQFRVAVVGDYPMKQAYRVKGD